MPAISPSFLDTWKERLRALRTVPPLLQIVWQSGPSVVAGGLLCRVCVALIPLLMLSVARRILDGVQGHFKSATLPAWFWWWVAAEFLLAVGAGVIGRCAGYFDALMADRYSRHVSLEVMRHAARLDLATFEDPAFHDKLERARVQATDRVAMIQAFGTLLQQLIAATSLAVAVFWFSPWLMLLLVLAVTPAFLGESHFAFLGYALNIRQTPVRREMDYLRLLGASKETAKELKLFGLAAFITNEFGRLASELYQQNLQLARTRLWTGSLLSAVSTAGYYGAYTYVIYRTVTGELSWGTMQFLAGAIAGASANIQSIFSTFASIADQSLFLGDLVAFFALQPKLQSKPDALPAPRPIQDGFVFENVSFRYPGSDRLILDNLNLRIAAGERIALIGQNGQGKTTIVKLMTRLYDPTEGRILLDGVDLREYNVEELQREIGVIFQDFVRYDMTARRNIEVGRIGRPGQHWEVERAARKSLAAEVIDRLPGGYFQMLGRRFDGGVDLSGGEWQKLALARAYLRDAQVLILDEPTAALDARSEYEVFERFAELTEGKIALLISHRFSTVRMVDRIVVLEDGRIVEQGNHEELLRYGGRYADMFELQAAKYR